jgi:hypothetical protein
MAWRRGSDNPLFRCGKERLVARRTKAKNFEVNEIDTAVSELIRSRIWPCRYILVNMAGSEILGCREKSLSISTNEALPDTGMRSNER